MGSHFLWSGMHTQPRQQWPVRLDGWQTATRGCATQTDLSHFHVDGISDDFSRILVIDVTGVRDQLLIPDSEIVA